MKRFLITLGLVIGLTFPALGQLPQTSTSQTSDFRHAFARVTATGEGTEVDITVYGLTYHELSYTVLGTVSAITIDLECSDDGAATWASLGQATTTTGASIKATGNCTHIRHNVSVYTGTGTVLVVYNGAVQVAVLDNGTGSSTEVAFFDSNGQLAGDANFTFDGTLLTLADPFSLNGMRFTGDGDGAVTLLSEGDGSGGLEDLTLNLDDTANTGVISSSTGLTRLTHTAIGATYGADLIMSNNTGIIVGNPTQITTLATPEFQVLDNAAAGSRALIGRWSADVSGPEWHFAKSRNATIGSNTIVNDGDSIGQLRYFADDGTDFATEIANITVSVDDASPAANAIGAEMIFYASTTAGTLTEALRIDSNQFVGIGGEADPNGLLTLNQGAADGLAQTLKSSDVATGLTSAVLGSDVETDDYFALEKRNPTLGGIRMMAMAEDGATTNPFRMGSYGGTAPTAKTTAADALISFYAYEHDGANALADITADGNVFSVRALVGAAELTRMMVDEDGDLYSVIAAQTFDEFDDALLARAFDRTTSPQSVIASEWDDYVHYNEQDLIDAGILGAPIEEGGMWNVTQHVRLLNGAIWQSYERIQDLERQLYETQAAVAELARELGRQRFVAEAQ